MIRELTTSGSIRGEKGRLHISHNESEADLNLNPDHGQRLVNGISAFTAALFIVGGIAGAGVLALPRALADTGWTGVVLIIVIGILACTCGVVLSKSWLILRRDFPEYREHVRDPYPVIGFRAYGKTGKYIVQICINATLIGYGVVFILLAADNLNNLIDLNLTSISTKSEYRVWLVICAVVLLPFTWLPTPKDFWPIALFAMIGTAVALLLIMIKIGVDFDDGVVKTSPVTTSSFFSAFASIVFSYGGTSGSPTIQCDMRRPSQFNSSVVMAYFVIVAMYLPVPILGFLAFGDDTQSNIILNLSSTSGITKCVAALVTSHVLLGFVMNNNPVYQQLEEWLNVPKDRVTLKSCVVRSFLMLFILGLAQAIPNFGLFLNLLGSSTTTLLTFVFPCLFYLKLEPKTSLHMKVFLYEIIVVAMLASVTSTYFSIKDIIHAY